MVSHEMQGTNNLVVVKDELELNKFK